MSTILDEPITISFDDMKHLDEKPIFSEEWDSMANLVSEEESSINDDGSAESRQHQNENDEILSEEDEVEFFSTEEINSVLRQWQSDKYDELIHTPPPEIDNSEILIESNARSSSPGDLMSLPEFVMISEGVKELPPLKLDEGKLTNFDWTTYRDASFNLAKLMKQSDKSRKSLTMKPKIATVRTNDKYKSVKKGLSDILKTRQKSRKQLQKLLQNINKQQKKKKYASKAKTTTITPPQPQTQTTPTKSS